MHLGLPLLWSSRVLGQRSASEGAQPGLEVFCSGVGGLSEPALFLHLWSSQRAAEDGGVPRGRRESRCIRKECVSVDLS